MIGTIYMTMSLRLNNMRKGLHILIGLVVILASCEKNTTGVSEGQPIYLSAKVPEMTLTKVPYEGSAPTTSNPLNVDVWATTKTDQSYFQHKEDSNGNPLNGKNEGGSKAVAIHTSAHFQSGDPQLLSKAVYPSPGSDEDNPTTVYFVAMHPQSIETKSWTTPKKGDNAGKIAVYTFTGCEDVMYAPEVAGAYNTGEVGVINSPTLAFEHLLTKITVSMGIDLEEGENLEDIKKAWGPIEAITIQAYDKEADNLVSFDRVTIDLTKGAISQSGGFSYDTDINFDYAQTGSIASGMTFYKNGTDAEFPGNGGYTLTNHVEELAYVMCAPVTAITDSHEYVINVETKERGQQQILLDLKKSATEYFTGSTRGKHFGVILKFKKGRAVATVAKVTPWVNGGYGSGEIED